MRLIHKTFFLAAAVAVLFPHVFPETVFSQEIPVKPDAGRPEKLTVFLSGPEAAAYASEIPFAAVAAGPGSARVVVDIVRSGDAQGEIIVLEFSGREDFAGRTDKLVYRPRPGETAETTRKETARLLQLGLLRFASHTPAAGRLDVLFEDAVKPTAVDDPWNFWVFSLSANGFLNGQKSSRFQSWFGALAANRVTPEWKIRASIDFSRDKNSYDYEGYLYENVSTSKNASGLVVRSLNDHWSLGLSVTAGSSTFNNYDFRLAVRPAVEFDLFPYSEATKKQLCLLYYAGPEFVRYREETIFDKRKETLWKQTLSIALGLKRPWGSMSAVLTGSHYFHDLGKNRLRFDADVSWRIVSGLSLTFDFGGARIRDLLALPKGGASLEEVLLRRRQLATGYDYYLSAGLSFTFGSVNSNLVNPRFGDSGGTSISISF